MKLLFLDIETAPNTVHVWGLFNQDVGLNQIVDAGYTLCWSAKWYGDDEIFHSSVADGTEHMLRQIHCLLDEADAVCTYNGKRFDIPTLNKEFVKIGLTPPAPYKQIDLLSTARSQFRFASNKLDYVARFLGLGSKLQHKGHDLWKGCMEGDPEALAQMEAYNKHDVILLERVYQVLLPWIRGHYNISNSSGTLVCPKCGGNHYQRRGSSVTTAGNYPRFHCQSCGAWFRGNKSETKGKDKFIEL